jgi:lysophospholipase L1-like esterase
MTSRRAERRDATVTVNRSLPARLLCLGALLATLFFPLLSPQPMAATQDRAEVWIGTWASVAVGHDPRSNFERQTLRQIVHTSVAGSSARIRVSNLFGTQPLKIEDPHIALRSSGASIVAVTDRRLRFGGRESITIPPGESATSDAIEFALPSLSDVAISFYLPGPVGAATFHPSAHQTNYIASGDGSASQDLPGAATAKSYYFLTNLDVRGAGLRGAVVALGASVTEGFSSTDDANRRWPDDLARRLTDAGLGIGVLNAGISGNRLLAAGAGQSALARFDRDVLAQPGVRWVIFADDPINDLGSTKPPPSADALIEGMKQLIEQAHRKHVRFFCSTLTPFQGANYWTPDEEVTREKVDAFLRSDASGCDALVDMDTATHDPAHPAQYLAAFDSGDHLHPNDAGMKAIANAVSLDWFLHQGGTKPR